jgi:tripeptidyl-peptidase-1
MLDLSTFLSIAVAAQAVLGTPIRARTAYSVKETHAIPRRWAETGPAPGNHMLQMQIGLKQSNFDQLERHLYEGLPSCSRYLSDISN